MFGVQAKRTLDSTPHAFLPSEEWPPHAGLSEQVARSWVCSQMQRMYHPVPNNGPHILRVGNVIQEFTTLEYLGYWLDQRQQALQVYKITHMHELEDKMRRIELTLRFLTSVNVKVVDIGSTEEEMVRASGFSLEEIQEIRAMPIYTLERAKMHALRKELDNTRAEIEVFEYATGMDLINHTF